MAGCKVAGVIRENLRGTKIRHVHESFLGLGGLSAMRDRILRGDPEPEQEITATSEGVKMRGV